MKKNLLLPFLLSGLFFFSPEGPVEISSLRHYVHPNFARIVIDIETLREYTSGERTDLSQIYVDIYQAKLSPSLLSKTFPFKSDYVTQILAEQKTESTVRITAGVDFKKISSYRIWHLFDPFRIVIDIYPQELVSQPEAPPKLPQPAKSGYTLPRQLGLGIKTVVIDPGHGGSDPGYMGKDNQKEKDIVLDVARRLKELLEKKAGLEVILTREKDVYLSLEARTMLANQKKADLFLSIHANASQKKDRRGIETFFLNFSPDPSVNEIAARENATSTKRIGEMEDIIKKIVQNSKIIESKELAEKIQQNLVKYLSLKHKNIQNLGVKGGPFWVLIGGKMPSVLVEISHLSHPQEAARLRDLNYRQDIARGIFEGIREYIQSLGKDKNP